MKNLPKEKFMGVEGLIKQLEAKVASLEHQVEDLQNRTTRKDISNVPNITSYGAFGAAIGIRKGVSRYIDVEKTLLRDTYGGYRSVLKSSTPSCNNVVWDGCWKFYGVYKE